MALLTSEFMAKLDGMSVAMRKVLAGRYRGERRSRRRGRSVEFADYRDYVWGDDLRFLDWHLLARLDRLFLKLYHDEEELRLTVVLDTSRSMAFGEPTKIHHARRAAAALAYVGLSSLNRVKVLLLSETNPRQSPWLRGVQSAGRVFDLLESARPDGPNALHTGLRRYVSEARPSGVLLLVSDLLDRDGAVPALKPLVRPMLDVHLIQILAPDEVQPDLDGDLKLVDSEIGDAVEVTATASLREIYRRNLAAYLGDIEAYARRHGIGHIFTTTAVSFEDLVLRQMRSQGVLR
jgi:uncharacterized protein (DUF58 family)